MKIPKATKLPSGKWRIQLRLGGESYSVTEDTLRGAQRRAERIKAEYRVTTLQKEKALRDDSRGITVKEAIGRYIKERDEVVSPSTLRGYETIAANRWQGIQERDIESIRPGEWQTIVNAEAKLCGAKTLRNAWGLLSAALAQNGVRPPKVTLPQVVGADKGFFTPEQISAFVAAVKDTKYAVPLLLALCSLRISEIYALDWRDIPANPDFIPVRGAVVPNAEHKYVKKPTNKSRSSARNVPALIPELREAIERDRQPGGCVSPVNQHNLRLAMGRICAKAGLPDIGIHGLRHSFASLAYHLRVPEQIAMEIGGWSDPGTMRRIYTHIAQSDVERYTEQFKDFFAHENAHEVGKRL